MAKQLDLFTSSFRLTDTGLEVVGKPDFEDWMEYGQSLKVCLETITDNNKSFPAKRWRRELFKNHRHNLVYVVRDNDKSILYVGSTYGDIRHRMSGHRSNKTPLWNSVIINMPDSLTWEVELIPTANRNMAFKIEAMLINSLEPKLNERIKSQ